MTEEKIVKPSAPPYVSYRTFIHFLDDLKNGIPYQIDRSVFTYLSGGSYSQLLSAIRYLGLVDSTDKPTETLRQFVESEGEERQAVFTEILKKGYGFLFVDFDLASATPKGLEDRFRENGTSGETTRRCIAFFLSAAKDAGITIGNRIAVQRGSDRKSVTRSKSKKKEPLAVHKPSSAEGKNQQIDDGGNLTVIEVMMSKIPSFDPTWSKETQENYMNYIERVFSLMEKISGTSLKESNKLKEE